MNLPAPDQLPTLLSTNFGYLSGDDLCQWCDPALLIARQNVQPNALFNAYRDAMSEIQSKLINMYDLYTELLNTSIVPAVGTALLNDAGGVGSIALTCPGTGYIAVPAVTLVNAYGDTTGTGATATAAISPSILSSIEVLACGRHYTAIPTVAITGGGGTGAQAVATIDNYGHVTGIAITEPGSGFTSVPDITITGNGVGAIAVAVISFGQLTGFTVTNAGTGYILPPIVQLPSVFSGSQIADQRIGKLVKITSIFAIRNAMATMANVSDHMMELFHHADKMVDLILEQIDNLPLYRAGKEIRSDVQVVYDRFKQIG